MSKKIALCRVSDTEPLLSLVPMLEYCGYECVLPDRGLRDYLRSIGCTNVDEFEDMRDRWGAEMPPSRLKEIGIQSLMTNLVDGPELIDLYVDVNAFHNGPLLWKNFLWLRGRTLCYFINGGPPRSTSDKGDGITPVCPVITTNQWYATDVFQDSEGMKYKLSPLVESWRSKSYVFYPSFNRWDRIVPRTPDFNGSPVCFCHNVMGWGYGEYVEAARKLGVKFYGGGSSPDGLVRHEDVFAKLAKAPCVVYLKAGGAVDYSILEAMAMGVPIIVPEKYAIETILQSLLCDSTMYLTEISDLVVMIDYLKQYKDNNFLVGSFGKDRIKELCWQTERDGPGFKSWIERMFP